MKEKFIPEINSRGVHYGSYTKKIMDLFSRQEERGINVTKKDDRFFSMLWQAYAWAAIIGFRESKRIKDADLSNKTSFKYQTITNSSEDIAHALILMAIGKIDASKSEEILDSRKILNIIGEYAEGGAKHVLELRQTPGKETMFNYSDDFFLEIYKRKALQPI
jgi:hypothetical protein